METNTIEDIVNRLRTTLWPLAIYRFNYPEEEHTETGKLNLLIIVADDEEPGYRKAIKARHILEGSRQPDEVIVRHAREFRKRSQWLDSLERRVRHSGTLLYGHGEEQSFVNPFALPMALSAARLRSA